ncbi:MAG: DUF1674 domain-containing protein [Hyphomicrobiaceae bacterium]|nr:DUF1674 domain-containing protein [Hyphomicrobiaceae bacterium]MCC0009230.1 DUF1674 domain-containing protein [Hyphomicrobiaceae bacterium]
MSDGDGNNDPSLQAETGGLPDTGSGRGQGGAGNGDAPVRSLTPEAQRALAEAEQRRRQQASQNDAQKPREVGGRNGPDPARYGDWEKGGIASDF